MEMEKIDCREGGKAEAVALMPRKVEKQGNNANVTAICLLSFKGASSFISPGSPLQRE
jgi:hypothetical protein